MEEWVSGWMRVWLDLDVWMNGCKDCCVYMDGGSSLQITCRREASVVN